MRVYFVKKIRDTNGSPAMEKVYFRAVFIVFRKIGL
jgi:hypothetical protein